MRAACRPSPLSKSLDDRLDQFVGARICLGGEQRSPRCHRFLENAEQTARIGCGHRHPGEHDALQNAVPLLAGKAGLGCHLGYSLSAAGAPDGARLGWRPAVAQAAEPAERTHLSCATASATHKLVAVAVSVFGWMIDLDGLARCHRSRRQGRGLGNVLRLVQHHHAVVHPGDDVDARDRLDARDIDNAIDVLLVVRSVHVFVLSNVLYPLNGLVLVAGVDLGRGPIAFGAIRPLSLSLRRRGEA